MYIHHVGDNIYCRDDNYSEAVAHALVFDLTKSTSVDDSIIDISNNNRILYIASIRNNVGIKGAGSFLLDYIKETNAFIYLESNNDSVEFFEKNGFINYMDNIYVFNAYKNGKPLTKDVPDIYHIEEIIENTLRYSGKKNNLDEYSCEK